LGLILGYAEDGSMQSTVYSNSAKTAVPINRKNKKM